MLELKVEVPKQVSSKVLTIGVNYKNHRGGIGGVIDTYSLYFNEFNFIATYKPQRFKLLIFPYFIFSCIKILYFLACNREIEIVHIHGAARGSVYRKYIVFVICKSIFRKKVIYHSHGSELKVFYETTHSISKYIMHKLFNGVDLIICLSKQWKYFFESNFTPNSVVVLENIVNNSNVISPPELFEKVNFLFLGALGKRKGIFDLLEVINNNKFFFEGKFFLRVGGNGEVNKLCDFIEKNDLKSLVKYEGWVSGDEKNRLLENSNVYILPSYNEGLPLSILEAMSFGLAVISTPVGGTPEVVHDNINGYLIQPGDSQMLGQTIKSLLGNKDLVREMGKQSLRIVNPYYAEYVIPKLTDLYIRLIK